jgi:UDP-N-acetylglucosamine 2-epimerase (non-hydrolysing)
LVTGHRREYFGDGFLSICKALHELAVKFPNMNFLYPVHLNPNVMKPVYAMLSNVKNIHLIEPLEYELFSYLLRKCYFVLTDSGGVQEEAPSLGKPVLVMRFNTERPEALQAGTVRLVGADQSKIIEGVSELILNKESYSIMAKSNNPYGDGTASKKIVEVLSSTIY